jgi:hypothetical protein
MSSWSGLERREYGRRDSSRWPRGTLCRRSPDRYSSLADSDHGVCLFIFYDFMIMQVIITTANRSLETLFELWSSRNSFQITKYFSLPFQFKIKPIFMFLNFVYDYRSFTTSYFAVFQNLLVNFFGSQQFLSYLILKDFTEHKISLLFHKSSPLVHIANQINSVHISSSYFCNIQFNNKFAAIYIK